MTEFTDADGDEVMDELGKTFSLLMDAFTGELEPPVEIEPSFSGDKAHAIGSARHIAEEVEAEGYSVEVEYVGEVTPLPSHDERHRVRISVETK